MTKELFEFAYVHDFDGKLAELAEKAEDEDWEYRHTEADGNLPILRNYVWYTFKRLHSEGKITIAPREKAACFNTGLVTETQEPLFALFVPNRNPDQQPWFLQGFRRRGERDLSEFDELPPLAQYFEDPSHLVFDIRRELRVNYDHIVSDHRDRFPDRFESVSDYELQRTVRGAIDNARHRVRRNYKAAIPQFYRGRLQLLLPLCLSDPKVADLALVVERKAGHYRAATVLTLDMAYNNARLVAKQDRDWLAP